MKVPIGFLSVMFAKCIRLYPTEFRLEFEEEMCEVFVKALIETKNRKLRDLITFTFREFRDLPKNLVLEHRNNLRESHAGATPHKSGQNPIRTSDQIGRSNWMNEMDRHGDLNLHGSRQRILAAMPLFLFGLGISLTSLIYRGPWYSISTGRLILSLVIGLIPMLIIAAVGVIAFIRRIPDWGLAWVGSAFMGIILFIKTLAEELADVGQRIVSEPFEVGIVILLFLAGVALLVIVGVRGWQRGGLLSIGFSVTFTLSFLWALMAAPFYLDKMAVWAGPIGLLLAGMTYIYADTTQLVRFIILVGIGIVNLACIMLANTVWQDQFLPNGGSFSPIAFIFFMLAFLVCGPVMGLITRPIQQKFRQA